MANRGAEPTEKPTPRQLWRARQRGQVAVSRDLARALAFLALIALATVSGGPAVARVLGLFRATLSTPLTGAIPLATVARRAFDVVIALSVAPSLALLVVAVAATLLQTRGLFSWPAVAPDFRRLSPGAGWARLFSARTPGEIGLALLKVTLVVAVAAASLQPIVRALPRLVGATPGSVLVVIGTWADRVGLHVAAVLIVLGALDAWLGLRRHQRELMMTRDEVKREQKELEGDRHLKAERQRLHRELGEEPKLEPVRGADFVAVDLERLAVAVRYERGSEGAPLVVAKGQGLRAEIIKQTAREAGVPIHLDVALARALYDVDDGKAIPESLFDAVAEVLRAVWGANRQGGPARLSSAPEPARDWKRV